MVNTFHYSVGCRQVQLHFWSEILEFQNMGLQYCILKHLTYEVITTLTCKSTDTKKNHILKWAQALSCTDNQHKRIEWEKSHGLGHDRSVTVAKWPILVVWDRQASVLFVSASAVSCAHFIVLFGFNLFLWLDIWIATKFSTFKSNKLRCYL